MWRRIYYDVGEVVGLNSQKNIRWWRSVAVWPSRMTSRSHVENSIAIRGGD